MNIVIAADDSNQTVDAVRSYLANRTDVTLSEVKGASWVDIARSAAELVAAGKADFGVLLCWTGTGVAMVANKVSGVRAATAWEPWIAKHARLWNDANVLTLSLKRTKADDAVQITQAFLAETVPDPKELPNIEKIEQS